jgi:uncharacterized protein YjiS (DUF1127 family)
MVRCNNTQGVSPMTSFANVNRTASSHDTSGLAADFLGFASLFRAVRLLSSAMGGDRVARLERQQMARELATYTDRDLGELGFSRADLPMIAAGTYRR